MSEEKLNAKIKELENLQQQFDDFVESSKEVESELEIALKESNVKYDTLQKKYNALDEKFDQSSKKAANMSAEYVKISSELSKLKDQHRILEESKRNLEIKNSELQDKNRILEASQEDLQHKVTTLEEELYFTQNDLFELEKVKAESEHRLKTELTQIQAELAKLDGSPSGGNEEVKTVDGDKFQEEINSLRAKLSEMETRNETLNMELNKRSVEGSIITHDSSANGNLQALQQKITELSDELSLLQQHNEELNNHLQERDSTANELNEELERTQEELLTKAQQIDVLKADIITKDTTYTAMIEDLRQQLESKIIEVNNVETQLSEALSKICSIEINSTTLSVEKENLKQKLDQLENGTEPKLVDEDKVRLERENERLIYQLNSLNAKLNKYELQGVKEDILHDVNPIASPKRDRLSSSALSPSTSSTKEISPSTSSAKKRNLSIHMDDIYKPSEPVAPPTLKKEKSLSSKRLSSTTPLRSSFARRTSSGTTENSGVTTYSSEIAAIDEAIDKLNIEQILLESTSSNRVAARNALMSMDLDVLKAELIKQTKQYEELRKTNARILQQALAAKGSIQVCCRTRPPIEQEMQDGRICIDVIDDGEISCFDRRGEVWRSFSFDKVWPTDCTQADVFADIEPLVLSATDGYNVSILAYGQTGSGKTFTMNGYGQDFGVSYRTLHKMFELLEFKKLAALDRLKKEMDIDGNKEGATSQSGNSSLSLDDDIQSPFTYLVEVSMMEIYNEQVNDLLDSSAMGLNLDIRQNADGGTHVPGLKQVPVMSLADVMKVFGQGSANRATASTNLNEHSSRSHLILTVTVTSTLGDGASVRGKLNLVDLAGSEKVSKSGVTGAAMKEAQHINKSLSALGDVLEALDQKSKHVPYRNSKLTYLLQDSLSGQSRTMMIVTVCPTEQHADETLFTLQFAARVRNITYTNSSNKRHISTKNIEEGLKILKGELKDTKRQKTVLEEAHNELKKEIKRIQDKYAALVEGKSKVVDDIRKSSEANVLWLTKQNQELTTRLVDEKEQRQKMMAEVESLQRTVKKLQDQMKQQERQSLSHLQAVANMSMINSSIALNSSITRSSPSYSMSSIQSSSASSKIPRSSSISTKLPLQSSANSVAENNETNSLKLSLEKPEEKTIPTSTGTKTPLTPLETIQLTRQLSMSLASMKTSASVTASVNSRIATPKSSAENTPNKDKNGVFFPANDDSPSSYQNNPLLSPRSPQMRPIEFVNKNDILPNQAETTFEPIKEGNPKESVEEDNNIDNDLAKGLASLSTVSSPNTSQSKASKVIASTILVSLPSSPDKTAEPRSRSNSTSRGSDAGSVRSGTSASSTRARPKQNSSFGRTIRTSTSNDFPQPSPVRPSLDSSKNSRILRGTAKTISDTTSTSSRSNSRNRATAPSSNASSSTSVYLAALQESSSAMSFARKSSTPSEASIEPSTTSSTSTKTSLSPSDKASARPMPASIANRSKEALQKHQERMDRIREQRAQEARASADRLSAPK